MRRGPVHESGSATGDGGPGASVPVHSAACALLGISRSSLYHRPEAASEVDLSLIGEIDGRYLETPFCGSKRMKAWLERRGMQVSRKRLMRAIGAADHLPAATVLPEAITTSASLSLLIISSGVCFLFAISSPFFAQDPKNLPGPFFGGQVKGNRSITGVQQLSSDPHIESFDGLDLPGLAQEVPAVVERARARRENEPRYPAYVKPAPPARCQHRRWQESAQPATEEGEAEQQQPETLRFSDGRTRTSRARLGAVGQVAARIGGGCLPMRPPVLAFLHLWWNGHGEELAGGTSHRLIWTSTCPGSRARCNGRGAKPRWHIYAGFFCCLGKWDFSIKLRRSLAETTVSAAEYTGM